MPLDCARDDECPLDYARDDECPLDYARDDEGPSTTLGVTDGQTLNESLNDISACRCRGFGTP